MSDEQDDAVPAEDDASATTLSQMTVTQIEERVGILPSTVSHDQMLRWLMLAMVLAERSNQIKHKVEALAIDWIKGRGPLTNGPIVYTMGQTKVVRCTDIVQCMKLLLEACGGDLNALCGHLAASPYKHGSCHELLTDDQWRSVFREVWQDKIVLKSTDTRYLPRPKCKSK